MGTSHTFLDVICLTGIVFYLWRYFGFVDFDLNKFKPVSPLSRIWKVLLAVGFPLLGLLSSFEKDKRMILVGIGIMALFQRSFRIWNPRKVIRS